MKTHLLLVSCITSVCFSVFGQQKAKTESYVSKIKSYQQKEFKRGYGLEKLNQFNHHEVSTKWIVDGDKVLINAISETVNDMALKKELVDLGFTGLKIRGKVITAWGPMDSIPKLENCKTLAKAIPEFKPTTNVGLTTNQAVTSHFSETGSEIFDVNGEGIKIGILSDSYNSRGDAQTTVESGDLPGVGNPNGFMTPVVVLSEINRPGGSDEGRGMAELVHDIAPAAELFFYSAFNGIFDFADGIRALRAAGCDVIVDDIGYLFAPYFQDGVVAQAADEVVADGAVYLSSAGNSSSDSYENEYVPIVVNDLEFHDFGGGDTSLNLILGAGQEARLFFQWDDPSVLAGLDNPPTDTDLDIFLFNSSTGEIIAASTNTNATFGAPIELIEYTNETTENVEIELVVLKGIGPSPRRIKYIDQGGGTVFVEDYVGINAGTCFGHSNAKGTIAVGAQAFFLSPEFKDFPLAINVNPAFGSATTVNNFSSYGGTPILVDPDGNDIELDPRFKPDIVGTDGVNTTSFPDPSGNFLDIEGDGFPNFFGTSAAAPNIAAIVALMLQEKKDLTPAEVVSILEATAIDLDDPLTEGFDVGYDVATGNGFVQADKALASLQGTPTVYRYEAINSISDEFLQTLRDDDSLDLALIDGALINIKALAIEGLDEVESLRFELSSDVIDKTEQDSAFPFSLYGDDGNGDFRNGEIKNGEYTLVATSFSEKNGQGASGNIYEIDFEVFNSARVSSFVLVNIDTNEEIAELSETIDRSLFEGVENIAIRGNIISARDSLPYVEKVLFDISGAFNQNRQDVTAPFEFDAGFTFDNLVAGDYTLEATPSARRNGDGTEGETTIFEFEIIDDAILNITNVDNQSLVLTNKSASELMVSSESESAVSFAIYSDLGQKVYQGSVSKKNQEIIPASQIGSGIFIIRSLEEAKTNSKKFYLN